MEVTILLLFYKLFERIYFYNILRIFVENIDMQMVSGNYLIAIDIDVLRVYTSRVRSALCERALKTIVAPGVYSRALINNLNKLTDEIYSLAVSVSQLRFIYHLLLVDQSPAASAISLCMLHCR